jgi:hypothetical protein
MSKHGQVLIVVAVLLTVALLLLALAVDGGRLYLERGRLERSAQAAADAGIGRVAEHMVTLVVPRMTEAASLPGCEADAGYGTPGATCTATPLPQEIAHWLTDDDRATLVAPVVRTQVASEARAYAVRNQLREEDPETLELEIDFPYAHNPQGATLRLLVSARRRVAILLAGLLGRGFVELSAQGLSEIPQR